MKYKKCLLRIRQLDLEPVYRYEEPLLKHQNQKTEEIFSSAL